MPNLQAQVRPFIMDLLFTQRVLLTTAHVNHDIIYQGSQ